MSIPIYQVDSFADVAFKGNPAGVCLLRAPAEETWMQQVAAEMNLSETAFLSPQADDEYALRWFTPAVEVELCGHATLAAAHILWESEMLPARAPARFRTASGLLIATHRDDHIQLDFPVTPPQAVEPPDGLLDALGVTPVYVGQTRSDYLVEVDNADVVRDASPDIRALVRYGIRGAMITARSDEPAYDFISRFFAPGAGVDEDPVTGSAHCALAPYWSARLAQDALVGYQASARGGIVRCRVLMIASCSAVTPSRCCAESCSPSRSVCLMRCPTMRSGVCES